MALLCRRERLAMTAADRPDWYWELALAVNAAFKGMLGALGESGHICASAHGCTVSLDTDNGFESLMTQVAQAVAELVGDGDVVVVADKVVAAALRRIAPRALLTNPDPKTQPAQDLADLAQVWSGELGFPVEPTHLLLADEFPGDRMTVGTDVPNIRCAELATRIRAATGRGVDVLISDTDTGLDTRTFLINTLTIGATPLGATAGVNIYEAMRCAVAAEFVRGHHRGVPVVICKPAERRRVRAGIGEARPYPGFLDARREAGLTYA